MEIITNLKKTVIYNPNGSLENVWKELYPILEHFGVEWCDGIRPIYSFTYGYNAVSIDGKNQMGTSDLDYTIRTKPYNQYNFIDVNDIIYTELDKAVDCFLFGDNGF